MKSLQINSIYENIDKEVKKKSNFFISDWNLDIDDTYISNIINESFINGEKNVYNYFSADEDFEYLKQKVLNEINLDYFDISNIAFSLNGTTAIFTSLLLLEQMAQNFLLFTPTYFLYSDLLKYFGKKIYYYDFYNIQDVNLKYLENILDNKQINVVVITDPLFSIGKTIPIDFLENITKISSKREIIILIDGMFSNLIWGEKIDELLPTKYLEFLFRYKKVIYIDSLTKKLGLNGNKFSIIYANKEFISKLQNYQIYTVGSFSSSQIYMIDQLYDSKNKNLIINQLESLKVKSQNIYKLVETMIQGTDIKLYEVDSGYYSCISIPKKYFKQKNDIQIFKTLLDECGIITLPLSIYHFNTKDNYAFRINLLKNKSKILNSIDKIIEFLNVL
ncbi:aminotransferase class I/II-fold pyridoxal phosphate-dependent enzyme [Thomasclavelia cocleata]|uniref:aminotransferase class I/II-fold pyridoxal phosphate-dependent enzyme n=5 Tax=Thomasclavelia cocleata TaxID=69824 RepID=UPI00255B09E3|nr:aminotransferase class I/II-fold pyridoxal phosphate-dependent enzyme [Thomasclavelia cocleata]